MIENYLVCEFKEGFVAHERYVYFPVKKDDGSTYRQECSVSKCHVLALDDTEGLVRCSVLPHGPQRVIIDSLDRVLISIIDAADQGHMRRFVPKENIIQARDWEDAQYQAYRLLGV